MSKYLGAEEIPTVLIFAVQEMLPCQIFSREYGIDSFVVKALGTGNCENIIFKNSVLWNDFARPMEVGVELRAEQSEE